MDYVSALVPPTVMAIAFTFLIRTLIKSQGGANKAKEDAVVDAALATNAAHAAHAAPAAPAPRPGGAEPRV
ncbi:hypothetical protein ACFYXS_34335 [Streptomyces sp. NPDC002574]|uniref:hypothetical protein n=1 Tax=Streptomyces sp. NPDC002574 TaxID=3364652 RepID=UPI0036BAAFE2